MYKLWQVFSEGKTEFYVINTRTRKVQSVWKLYVIAANVISKLNAQVKQGVI
jgi:hypothetical protein